MTTKINVKLFVSLEFFGEVFLLRNILLVSFEVFVDILLAGLLVYFQTVNPSILPVQLRDVFRCAERGHIQHKFLRLGYAICTLSRLDRGQIVENISNGGSGDARERKGYMGVDKFPDAVRDFLARNHVARDFVSFFKHYSMSVKWNTF